MSFLTYHLYLSCMKMLISKEELDSKGSRADIPLECLQCHNTHYRTKNIVLRVLNGNQSSTLRNCFCSKKCKDDYRKIRQPHQCKHCETPIERTPSDTSESMFCSHSCFAKHNNTLRRIIKPCLNCSTPYYSKRGKKGVYCSSKCNHEHKKKLLTEKIECGEYHSLNNGKLRRYLIEKHGEKCMLCGWNSINPKTLRCPIQVDHKDGNAENNKVENLQLICPNCHSLTPTYMNLNRGKGRKIRRERYLKIGIC